MNFNFELCKQILIIAMASGCVTTLTVQKVKEALKKKWHIYIASFLISMIIGTLFARSFSDATWVYCLWAGFFTFIDADLLYQMLEEKIFTPFKDMQKTINVSKEDFK